MNQKPKAGGTRGKVSFQTVTRTRVKVLLHGKKRKHLREVGEIRLHREVLTGGERGRIWRFKSSDGNHASDSLHLYLLKHHISTVIYRETA